MSDQQIVKNLETVWRSIAKLCRTLSEADWKLQTDCPGWSVQDQISHMAAGESWLLGRPAPDHTPNDVSHTRNERGEQNEAAVDWRRSWPPQQVLAEFEEVTAERLKALRALTKADFDAPSETPIGPGTMRDRLYIRILDCWVHEQDICRAVARPGHLEGAAVEHCVGRIALAMPYVVARKAQAADGATVVFDITGQSGRTLPIGVEGNRANLLDAVPATPDVRLTMDVETFMCLGCGRWTPDKAVEAGKVKISGDRSLGEGILSQMNVMI